jgi:hypothetical protein
VISGYHGQIDSVAILPAVAALRVWETGDQSRRWLWAGLLVGLAASIKTVPVIMVLALLPSSRSVREGISFLAAAAVVPLTLSAPFLIADGAHFIDALRYKSVPGLGGYSMLVEPDLVRRFLTEDYAGHSINGATRALYDHSSTITAAGLACIGAFLLRLRPRATDAAVFLWLGFYAFLPAFFPQYMVWGLPFFIMGGYLWQVAAVQAALVPVDLLFYLKPWQNGRVAILYFAIVFGLWIACLYAVFRTGGKLARQGRRVYPLEEQSPAG